MTSQKNYPALPLPEKQAWPALIALCIGFFMILLDQTIVSVATPVLREDLGSSYNQIVWINSAYLLTFAVPLLFTARLGDRFGQRNVYIVGMIIFTLSSLACGLAPDANSLIVARAVQGLGASLLTPQTMAVINRIFSRERRGAALGIWGMTAGLAALSGPLLGGIIIQSFSWHWIFFINVPIGVISVVMVAKFVPLIEPNVRPIDIISVVLSLTAVFAVVFGLQQGEEAGWAAWIWVVIAAGIGVAAVFVRRQAQLADAGNDPLMPLELFRVKNFSMGNIGIVCMGFAVAGTPLPIMLYLQTVHGLSALHAGLMVVPQALSSLFLSPAVGRWADKYSPNLLAAGGYGGTALSFIALAIIMLADLPLWTVPVAMLFLGLSNSFIWAPNSTSTMRDLKPHLMGMGSGVYNTTRQIGSVVGSAACGAVMQWQLASSAGQEATGAPFGWALVPAVGMMIIAVTAALSAYNSDAKKARTA